MSAEIGHFALIVAAILALGQSIFPMAGAVRRHGALMSLGGTLATGQFVFVLIAFGALTWAFLASDFSVANVVQNSHSGKPLLYKITGVWGEPRRLDGPVVPDPQPVRRLRRLVRRQCPARPARPGDCGPGDDRPRLPRFCPADLEPVRPGQSDAAGRARPEPDPAGSGPRLPSRRCFTSAMSASR